MRKAAKCLDPSQSIRLKSRYHELMMLEVYKPGWNKEEKQSQEDYCKVSAVGQGDVLALLNPHLLQLLQSHPGDHDRYHHGVSERPGQDCEAAQTEHKDVFKESLDLRKDTLAASSIADFQQVPEWHTFRRGTQQLQRHQTL